MRPPVDRELRRRRGIAVGFLVIGLFLGGIAVALTMHAGVKVEPADETYRPLFIVVSLALGIANLMAMRYVLIEERRVPVQVVALIDALVLGPIGWAFAATTLYAVHRERLVSWWQRRRAVRA